jgi:ATP-binding cassette subfamily B protein
MKDKGSVWVLIRQVVGQVYRKIPRTFILMLVIIVAAVALELIPPLLLRRIIDTYLEGGIPDGVWRNAVLYLLALLAASSAGFSLTLVTSLIGQNLLFELRLMLAAHLTHLPISYYTKTPVGEIMGRLTSDVDSVHALFSAGMISAVTDSLKIFGILTAMFLISPPLAGVGVATVPVIFLLANFFRKNMLHAQAQIRRMVSQMNTFLQEVYAGIRLVKLYGRESDYVHRFQEPLRNHLAANNVAAVYDAYFPCVLQVVKALAIALILWLGGRTSLNDSLFISIGSLAAMADLTTRLLSPIEALSQEVQTIQQAMAGLGRVQEILGEATDDWQKTDVPADEGSQTDAMVEVAGIHFGYQKDHDVLKDIRFTLQAGEKVAIVGRTGAGKTTLMNLLAGLFAPDRGIIRINGKDPYRLKPEERRQVMGVVTQQVHILEGTVMENITLRDSRITREMVDTAVELVGLQDVIAGLPGGFETRLGEGGTSLSHGQSQLLALARAVVTDPPLLLLDEPTSGMDAITEATIFKAFRSIGRNRTVLTISHRLSGVIDTDRVLMMANGRIVQSGTPRELAGEKGWYRVFRDMEQLGWSTNS